MTQTQFDYDRVASLYSRALSLVWLLTGCIYAAWTGSLVSWETALLFMPGIFVVSILIGGGTTIVSNVVLCMLGYGNPEDILGIAMWIGFPIPIPSAAGYIEVLPLPDSPAVTPNMEERCKPANWREHARGCSQGYRSPGQAGTSPT